MARDPGTSKGSSPRLDKELVAQWHPKKNGDLDPSQVSYGSNKRVWWLTNGKVLLRADLEVVGVPSARTRNCWLDTTTCRLFDLKLLLSGTHKRTALLPPKTSSRVPTGEFGGCVHSVMNGRRHSITVSLGKDQGVPLAQVAKSLPDSTTLQLVTPTLPRSGIPQETAISIPVRLSLEVLSVFGGSAQ